MCFVTDSNVTNIKMYFYSYQTLVPKPGDSIRKSKRDDKRA